MAHVKQKNSGLWVPQSTHEKIDSQKMFIENMEQHEANHTELIERIHGKVDSIAKLKALDVSSADSTIKSGTIVVVDGIGPYYYTLLSEEKADDEEIVAPNTGEGLWILSGGGGNLIVDEADYGEDTDSDQGGLILKIKKLFNKKTKTNFFPVTTTKAVRDTSTGKSLFQLLNIIPMTEDEGEIDPAEIRDADTLGGISADEFAQKKDYGGIICVLLAENWVKNGSSYTYTIAIPSLTGDEFFDVSLYDDGSATEEQISAFNELITRIDVNNGAVVVQASAQPTVSLSIVLRGMCNIDETVVVNLSEVVSKVNEFEKSLEDINSNLKPITSMIEITVTKGECTLPQSVLNNYNGNYICISQPNIVGTTPCVRYNSLKAKYATQKSSSDYSLTFDWSGSTNIFVIIIKIK